MWLVFLAVHLVGYVGYNLLLRRSLLDKVDKWTLATIMQTGVAIPIIPVFFFVQPDWLQYDWRMMPLLLVASALIIVLHITNVKTLQYLEASVYAILFNLRIVFTTILGILFLHEEIAPLQIAGGALIFMAIVTVRQKGGEKIHERGLRWGITAAVVISVLNLIEKDILSTTSFVTYALPVMVSTTVAMWAVLLARRRGDTNPFAVLKQPRMLQLMSLRALSAHGGLLALYAGGLLSVTTYISSLGVIGIVILGVLLLGERDYLRQKIIATVMAALGLTAILIAGL